MGWTSYHLDDTTPKGRKAELDAMNTWSKDGKRARVLRSAMIGSTYYAAIEWTDAEKREVWAAVYLTRIDNSDYFNFAYKDMSEDMGPYECKAPAAILDLLTPTSNEYAQEWRRRCRENLNRPKLADLPNGTRIKFEFCGTTYTATKRPPAYQFKTSWYQLPDGRYIPRSRIGKFEIITEPEARTA